MTKCDLPKGMWKVNRDELLTFAKKENVEVYETSALLGINVNDALEALYYKQNEH